MIRMYYIHGLCYGTHFLAWFYCCNTKFSRSLGALQVTNAPLQPSLPLCGGGKMPKPLMGIRQPEQAPPCQRQEQGPARTDKANLCWVCSQPVARLPDRPASFPKCLPKLLSLTPLQQPSFAAGPSSHPPVPSQPQEGPGGSIS